MKTLQNIFGITYAIAWSVGLYFQIALMYRTKCGDGFSLDNQLLSILGEIFFLCYNTYLMILNPEFYNIINFIFTFQCIVLGLVIFGLTFYYPRKKNKFNISVIFVIFIFCAMAVFYYLWGVIYKGYMVKEFYLFLGLGNCWVVLIKYLYQITLNYDKKSTVGFAIEGIIGDVIGCICIFLESILRYKNDNKSEINYPLILMAWESIFFDFIIIFQHYYLYRQ